MVRLLKLLGVLFDTIHLLEEWQQLLLHPLRHGVAVEDALHSVDRLFGQGVERPTQVVKITCQFVDTRRAAEIVPGVVVRQPASIPGSRLVIFINLNSGKRYHQY